MHLRALLQLDRKLRLARGFLRRRPSAGRCHEETGFCALATEASRKKRVNVIIFFMAVRSWLLLGATDVSFLTATQTVRFPRAQRQPRQ